MTKSLAVIVIYFATFSFATLSFATLSFARAAHAADQRNCQLVRQLSEQMGCSATATLPPPGPGAVALPAGSTPPPTGPLGESANGRQYLVNSTFGPSQCKIQDLSREVAKELRGECDTWVKERKADLGTKYITGTCTEACEECDMGLRRCSYKGVVQYSH